MKNYIPKSLKVTKPTNNKLIKISIILILLITVSIIFFFSNNPKSTLILEEKVFKGKYEEEKNFIKIDNKDRKPSCKSGDSKKTIVGNGTGKVNFFTGEGKRKKYLGVVFK